MTNYAYLDKQGILRIVENEEHAKEFAKFNGRVLKTTHACKNGVPAIFNKSTRVEAEVWCFAIGEAYFEPRQVQGGELRTKRYPRLIEVFNLYRDLLGGYGDEADMPKEKTPISTTIKK